MGKHRDYHPDFRETEVRAIVEALDHGDCVSVIGPPSVGKTRLINYLDQGPLAPDSGDRSDPWHQYAQKTAQRGPIHVVSIDPNLLAPALPLDKGEIAAGAWPGFELLVSRIREDARLIPTYCGPQDNENGGWGDEANALVLKIKQYWDNFNEAYGDLTAFDDPLHAHLALRALENAIKAVLISRQVQGSPIRLVIFMDEFERLLASLPDFFFVVLRGLRDRFKYQIMYVTYTRDPLEFLTHTRIRELESFVELFNDHEVWLGPYNDTDAWSMLANLEDRDRRKDDRLLKLMIGATGGFAGLLRAAYTHDDKLVDLDTSDYAEAAGRLALQDNVAKECATLLRALRAEEIDGLFAALNGNADPSNPAQLGLMRKSLIMNGGHGMRYQVWPLVLAKYMLTTTQRPEGYVQPRPVTLPEDWGFDGGRGKTAT